MLERATEPIFHRDASWPKTVDAGAGAVVRVRTDADADADRDRCRSG
ncbi:hypothetical protein B8V81_1774 [Paenibacillus pasadenensis]|uniref:Uncharacterized protein n=1 Tax=Paenibacillus pasadenensis TaxID=217090 RepID=A0A2N5NBA9_9BACL|nr:hypothetical protein B8V81_1774 [Paenibacillus pasadenensis]